MTGARPRPVIVMTAVLAGVDVLAAGAALADVIGVTAFGLFVLASKAVNVAWSVYVQSEVTPLSDPMNAQGVPLVPDYQAQHRGAPRDEVGASTLAASTALVMVLVLVLLVLLLAGVFSP